MALLRFDVKVGSPDGEEGEILRIRATSEQLARSQALERDVMTHNPDWEILEVTPA